jgi:ATP-binding cassette, subfamily B, bacterial PglK
MLGKLVSFFSNVKFIQSNKGGRSFLVVVLFSAFSSLVEAISLSSFAPFLAVVTDLSVIHDSKPLNYIYMSFNFQSETQFIEFLGGGIIVGFFLRAIVSYTNNYLIASYSYGQQQRLASRLFSIYLSGSLIEFGKQNQAVLTKSIMYETNQLTQLNSSLLMIVTEIMVMVSLFLIMLYVNFLGTIIITIVVTSIGLTLVKLVSREIRSAGTVRVQESENMYRALGVIFGNFRILKFQAGVDSPHDAFDISAHQTRDANVKIFSFQVLPRMALEFIAFGGIVLGLIVYVTKTESNIQAVIPLLVIFTLALYRLLPSLNRVLTSYNQIISVLPSLVNVVVELKKSVEVPRYEDLDFNHFIELDNVAFSYTQDSRILDGVSLKIPKGGNVAFIGGSGQGKSTLVDLLTGLIVADVGSLSVDGVRIQNSNLGTWRRKIGYVPQSVYLFDASIQDNIVNGRGYNKALLTEVISVANLTSFLNSMDDPDVIVGDHGGMVSGGQRQRIALARALYGKPEILVLDEATSGLDELTERTILDNLSGLGPEITIIMITHRTKTIDEGYTVYEVSEGKIIDV